jgi:hypothetical protein
MGIFRSGKLLWNVRISPPVEPCWILKFANHFRWVLFAPLNYLPEMAAQIGMPIHLIYYTITVAK